jgi:fucose 4-O-acetylase-like acetyltransferase
VIPNETGWPWNLDLLPITLFYYWMGWEVRKMEYFEKFLKRGRGTATLLTSGVLFVIFHLLQAKWGQSRWDLDLNLRDYGHSIWTTLGAGIGIVMILSLSEVIEQQSPRLLRRILIALGMQSLVILVFHYFVQQEIHYLMAEAGTQQGWLIIIVSWTAGVLIPVLLYLLLLKRIPWVSTVYGNPKGQP